MHWQHSIHRCWEILLPSPHKKTEREISMTTTDGHHQHWGSINAERGKTKAEWFSWVARVFDFVTNCWFWVFFKKKLSELEENHPDFFWGKVLKSGLKNWFELWLFQNPQRTNVFPEMTSTEPIVPYMVIWIPSMLLTTVVIHQNKFSDFLRNTVLSTPRTGLMITWPFFSGYPPKTCSFLMLEELN